MDEQPQVDPDVTKPGACGEQAGRRSAAIKAVSPAAGYGSERAGGHGLREWVLALKASSDAWLDERRSRHPTVNFLVTAVERDRILGGSLVAGAVAFRLFLLLVPMVVIVVAVIGLITSASSLSSLQIIHRLGLVGYLADSVASASKLSTGTSWSVIAVGLFALVLTARSFARALRTAYALAWGIPIQRWRHGTQAGLAVIAVLFLILALMGLVNSMRGASVLSTIGAIILSGVTVTGLWLLACRYLPHMGNRWHELLPGAVFVGVGVQALNIAVIYFTWKATRAEAFYGPMGLAIVMLAWLYIVARILTAAAVLNSHRYTMRTGLDLWRTAAPAGASAAEAASGRAEARRASTALSDDAGGPEGATHRASQTSAQTALAAQGADQAAAEAESDGSPVSPTMESGPMTVSHDADPEGAAALAREGKKGSRRRRIGALTLVALATIVAVIMMVSVWAHDFLLNTDSFVGTVAPVLKNPQVTRNVGQIVAQRTIDVTDAQQRAKDALPPRLGFIAAPIIDQVQQRLAKVITRLLQTDRGYQAWERILRFTHQSVVNLLTDQSRFLKVNGNEVSLDLLPLIVTGVQRLDRILPDVIKKHAPLPAFTRDQTPEEQRAALAQALGKPVNPKFAQITLFKSDQIQTAQRALRLFNLLVYGLIALTAVLIIAALLVSPRRLRTLMHIGIAAVIVVILAKVAINQADQAVVNAAAHSRAQPVIAAGVGAVFDSLQSLIIWGLIAGAIVGVLAYLAGRPRWLARAGHRTKALAGAHGRATGALAQRHRDPVIERIAAHRNGLLAAIVVVAVVLLLFFASSLGGSIAIIAVAALLAAGVYWLGRPPVSAETGGSPSTETGATDEHPESQTDATTRVEN